MYFLIQFLLLPSLYFASSQAQIIPIKTEDAVPYDIAVEINICSETDQNSQKYCSCKELVVSCDFSSYPKSPTKASVQLSLKAAWPADSVRRVCICGAPTNLQIEMTKKFLSEDHHNLSRIDVYNMEGPINVPLDFTLNFSGDLYMAKIKYIKELKGWVFGRGYTIDLLDTQDLACCSKITTPKLTSPVFFMEDTTVGLVQSGGLYSEHLWNSIVFNRVTFQKMESYALQLDRDNMLNASFTNCKFQGLAKSSIAVRGIVNFLIAHSLFTETCDPAAIGARGASEVSTIALIDNTFQSSIKLEVDGKTVAIWFNKFDSWDSYTFQHLGSSIHTANGRNREVSIEYNTVNTFQIGTNAIPPLEPHDNVVFNENLLSICACDKLSKLELPSLFKNWTNRCDAESNDFHCHLEIQSLQSECQKTSWPDFLKLCDNVKDAPITSDPSLNLTDIESKLKASKVRIESVFVNDMLNFVKSPFRIQEPKALPLEEARNEKNSGVTPTPLKIFGILTILIKLYIQL